MSRMFPFITESRFNPLGGECLHDCYGGRCWAKQLIARLKMQKYRGCPRLFESELKRVFAKNEFVFACDMLDAFGDWVPSALIRKIVGFANNSDAQFLFLTKNPQRYAEFSFDSNCVLGATIESDEDMALCYAPSRKERLYHMTNLEHKRKMVSIEPIMAFTPNFYHRLLMIKPEFVALGYDNYDLHLPEPSLDITQTLIGMLQAKGIKVYEKTMREKWNPK